MDVKNCILISWTLVLTVLLTQGSATNKSPSGLEFSVYRVHNQDVCARLRCANDDSDDIGDFDTMSITIYDVTKTGQKQRLAYVSGSQHGLYIDPARSGDINGTGTVSKSHAELSLNFRRESDCLYGVYSCVFSFQNKLGVKDTQTETVTPGSTDVDCTCSSITNQFARLTNRANEADRQISVLRQSSADLSSELNALREDLNDQEKEVSRLRRNSSVLQSTVSLLLQNDRDAQEEIAGLRRNDQNVLNALIQLKRNDDEQEQSIAELRHSDQAQAAEISALQQNDRTYLASINGLKRNDTEISANIVSLKRKDEAVEDAINVLRRDVRDVKQNIKDLRQNDNSIRDDISALQRSDRLQDEVIATLRHNDEGQQADIVELRRVDEVLQNQISALESNDTAFEAQISQLRSSDQAINQELAVLRRNDQVTQENVAVLRQNDNRVDEVITGLRHNDTVLQQAIDEARESDRVIQEEINRSRRTDEIQTEQIAQLRQTDTEILSELDAYSQNYTALVREVQLQREINTQLSERVTYLQTLIERANYLLNSTKVTTVTRITTSLVQSHCYRGMTSTKPREIITLTGGVSCLCDTTTDEGGYIVIQRRANGDTDFYRSWEEYRNGFGNSDSDYILGLDILHELSAQGFTHLRIDFTLEGKTYYAEYDQFSVGSESSGYLLTASGYHGNAGDALAYHSGSRFSTFDRDNDNDKGRNCAELRGGGWWYNSCYRANLNGRWGKNDLSGIIWRSLSETKSISFVEMKVRQAYEPKKG